MATLPVVDRPASYLIPSAVSNGLKHFAALKVAAPLALLLFLLGGFATGYAQDGRSAPKPVLHTTVMLPSSAPPSSERTTGPVLSRMAVQPSLSPVNTGSGIVYTCDPSIASATCTYLNTTVAGHYNDTFTNANANIYITYGMTGLGQSQGYYNFVTYNQYVTALGNIANKSAIQTSAIAALAANDATPYGTSYVEVTAALGTALGFTGMTGTTNTLASCTLGTAGCYNEIITITNDPGTPLYYDNLGGTEPAGAYDFYTTVEHETDEVLGTSSCVTTQTTPLSDGCDGGAPSGTGNPSAVDLFRYSSAANLVLDSSLSTTAGAYFSYDGGNTNGAVGVGGSPKVYNTLDNGDDYADYVASSPDCGTNQAVQDATGCPGEDAGITILNDGGSEIKILTAIGYQVPASTGGCKNPNPNPNPDSASFANPGDFNGDCKSDVLWRNSGSEEVYQWLMNGTAIASQGTPGGPTADWVIQGAGDFDGDGKSDILWRNSGSGEVYVWLMNGTAITGQGTPGTVSPASGWVIQGVGDFDGNGKSDILWRNSTTGDVYIWLMNGTAIASQGDLGVISSDWVIQGVGDFNGDGKADILWRNTTSGEVYVWQMNGISISGQGTPGTVSPASGWVIKGAGDFDGNGTSDILWQNSTSGEVYIWLMNGTTITNQGTPFTVSPSSGWVIQGVGDYNGDGKADILWRNSTSGDAYVWLMNGLSIANQGDLGDVSSSWVISPLLYP